MVTTLFSSILTNPSAFSDASVNRICSWFVGRLPCRVRPHLTCFVRQDLQLFLFQWTQMDFFLPSRFG
jgi:hypothetical protein